MALDALALAAALLLGYLAYRDWRSDRFMAVCCGAIALLMLITLGARHVVDLPVDQAPQAENRR